MSIDIKDGVATLTNNGWVIGKDKDNAYEIAYVKLKQRSYMGPWSVTISETESCTKDLELLKQLHEKFGKVPSGDLDWGF